MREAPDSKHGRWLLLAGVLVAVPACEQLIGANFGEKTTDPGLFEQMGGQGSAQGGAGGNDQQGTGAAEASSGGSSASGGQSSSGGSASSGGSVATGGSGGSGGSAAGGTGGSATGGGGNTVACDDPADGLVLNEIRGQGGTDYIELYNAGSSTLDLSGYQVSDGGNVDSIQEGTTLTAGDFLHLQTVSEGLQCPNDEGCFEFGVSANGEEIYLYDADGHLLDSMTYPDENQADGLADGETWGRLPDGCENITYLAPTPDEPNQASTLR